MKQMFRRSLTTALVITLVSALLFIIVPLDEADAWLGHVCEVDVVYTDSNGNTKTEIKTVIYWHGHVLPCGFECP